MAEKLPPQMSEKLLEAITGPKPPKPEPWCDITCPRQATHMWKDCECGGAQREFDDLRREREAEMEAKHPPRSAVPLLHEDGTVYEVTFPEEDKP